MLESPKGYEYWTEDGILDDAPEWAKKEFEEYQELMVKSTQQNESGELTHY